MDPDSQSLARAGKVLNKEDRKLQEILEFWLISAPGDKTIQQTWDTLSNTVQKQALGQSFKFHIPDLKVGSYESDIISKGNS